MCSMFILLHRNRKVVNYSQFNESDDAGDKYHKYYKYLLLKYK